MADALLKVSDTSKKRDSCKGSDDDGLLVNLLLEALTGTNRLNVGAYGRSTRTPSNYSAATQSIDDHLAGVDTALGNLAASPHALAGSAHSADTLANLNSKINFGDLDFDTAERPAVQHAIGGNTRHSADTLANLNALITSGDLDLDSASRPPNGTAGGALTGSYPNPDLGYDIASALSLYTCENTSWEDITGMSITPSAGTYLVWFNTHAGRTGTDDYGFIGLFIDTTLDTDSLRSTDLALGSYHSIGTQGVLTVSGSQAIKAKAKVQDAGTDFEIYDRSLMILRVTD